MWLVEIVSLWVRTLFQLKANCSYSIPQVHRWELHLHWAQKRCCSATAPASQAGTQAVVWTQKLNLHLSQRAPTAQIICCGFICADLIWYSYLYWCLFSLSWLTNILTFVIVIRTGRENVSQGAAALWDGDLLNLGEILQGLRVERSGGCIGRTQADGNICCSILIADLISCKKGKGNTIT